MKQEKKQKKLILDPEARESLDIYCDVVVSVVKRLTKEGFNFSTGKYEEDK